ncbi:MAG: hypothetical protein HQL54_01070 [Magnetococcales bacterium]|nr:hypothetical protein [Magnetococcales bacterium]
MMHSYEAEIDAKGQVRLLEPVQLHGPCRAVLTVLEPLPEELPKDQSRTDSEGWQQFVGTMKASPHFKGDPVDLQKAMRNEWD